MRKSLQKLVIGGGAGHDCRSDCVTCNPHHAMEVVVYNFLIGRFGSPYNKEGRLIKKLPYKEIIIK